MNVLNIIYVKNVIICFLNGLYGTRKNEKPAVSETIYRLPPDKKHKKGMRVRKLLDQPIENKCAVMCVKDGYVFYTNQPLIIIGHGL